MESPLMADLLVDLARSCRPAAARDPDEVLPVALGTLREIAGASTALVLTTTADGTGVSATAGDPLPPADLDRVDDAEPTPVAVPAAWAAAGVASVRALRLPGHLGVLALAWPGAPDDGPALTGALAVVESMLARLVADERLRDLRKRVDDAQHLAGMGDYDWHIPTDTNTWSDELYRIYGHEPQSFNASYERFLSAIHPDDRERIQGVHQHAYATGEPYRMIERIVRPSGEVRYLSSNGEVIRDDEGTPVRMRGTCIDITERVLAEQERERTAARFRALVESAPEAILVVDATGAVVQANCRAVDLLGGDPTGHGLVEVLPEAAKGPGVEGRRLDGSPISVDVETADLGMSEEQGMVAIFLQDSAPRLEREAMATRLGESHQRRRQALEINDNVVQGLATAVYALEQADVAGATTVIERTLAAARDMMDDLLDPAGEHLGPGDLVRSTATSLESGTPSPAASPAEPSQRATGRRVLVADDAEDIRALIRLKLSRRGDYEVVGEAADGEQAVELARELQPDLVVLDMAMPRMDGLQALPLIREAVPGIRVVVLSGFNQRTLEQEALAAGADRYLVKGGSLRELLDVIEALLQAA